MSNQVITKQSILYNVVAQDLEHRTSTVLVIYCIIDCNTFLSKKDNNKNLINIKSNNC